VNNWEVGRSRRCPRNGNEAAIRRWPLGKAWEGVGHAYSGELLSPETSHKRELEGLRRAIKGVSVTWQSYGWLGQSETLRYPRASYCRGMVLAGDARFFIRKGPFSLETVVRCSGGEADYGEVTLGGVAPLHEATEFEVSFLDNRRYLDSLRTTRAGAVIVHPSLAAAVPDGTIAIRSLEPYVAWARVCHLFHPDREPSGGIHPTATVDDLALVDPTASIGANVVVEAGASIGAGTQVGSNVVIERDVVIGADCHIQAGATLSHAIIGSRVKIGPGCRIGQEGFGFAVSAGGFVAVAQLGRVLIEDDVRIGANTTIDRGSARDTIVGKGTWIDNLVQIAHNVTIGQHCIIVAQVGIAGSTQIGDFVRLGGQSAIAGHLEIGARASIGAQAGVIGHVAPGSELLGSPAQPRREFLRQMASLKRATMK